MCTFVGGREATLIKNGAIVWRVDYLESFRNGLLLL